MLDECPTVRTVVIGFGIWEVVDQHGAVIDIPVQQNESYFPRVAINVCPAALHVDMCPVTTPRSAYRTRVLAPALLQFWDVPLHPVQNGRVGQFDPALAHHIHRPREFSL